MMLMAVHHDMGSRADTAIALKFWLKLSCHIVCKACCDEVQYAMLDVR